MSRVRGNTTWTICRNVALAALLSAACGGTITGDDPETGLQIEVTRGPIMPVAMEGEVNSLPVEEAVVRVRGIDREGRTEGRTAADGTIVLRLLPGRYEVEVRDCPLAMSLPAPETVEVARGIMVTVSLECDTGIR